MKIKSLIALLLAVVMCAALVSCTGSGEGSKTDAPTQRTQPTEAPTQEGPTEAPTDQPTEAPTQPDQPTEAPTEAQTDAPVNSYGQLTDAELQEFKLLLPVLLPDNTADYTFHRVMCFDGGLEQYAISGNSADHTSFVDKTGGAIWGDAAKIQAYGKNTQNRCEITVQPYNDIAIAGAKGILFWVDFSNVTIEEEGKLCASVTINTNNYRSTRGQTNTCTGYYYDGANWQETTNINACRMLLPTGFAGWVYVPATSYWHNSGDKVDGLYPNGAFDDKGQFTEDIPVDFLSFNMRCYTDGYKYSDAPDQYVIFDEILYIYG